jgi:hypothetical protein
VTCFAFVDSREAARAARARLPDARLVTDNPILAAVPDEAPIENLDGVVGQETANTLGERGVAVALAIDRTVAEEAAVYPELLPGGAKLAGHSARLFCSLFYRAFVLKGLKERAPLARIAAFVCPSPAAEPAAPVLVARFASLLPPLAQAGFFGTIPFSIEAIPTALPASINDTSIRDLGRRLAMLPSPLVIYEILRRLGIGDGRNAARRIVVVGENEALRETLPWLRRSGFGLSRAARVAPIVRDAAAAVPVPERQDRLAARVSELVVEQDLPFDATEMAAIARVAAVHLDAGLSWLAANARSIGAGLDRLFADGSEPVLLANGFVGPLGAVTYAECRRRGVRAVAFEHGVTKGISSLAESRAEASEGNHTDVLLACAPNAARSFGARIVRGELRFEAIGLPDQTRRLLRPALQRLLARRRLRLSMRERVAMHVSTWPYHANHRSGPGVASETATFERDRLLLQDVYARLDYTTVFKQYPTQRFPFEPTYNALFGNPGRVVYAKDEDFRYIRAAADVLVTGNPTSTLGWCVGTGVPMIWLESRVVTPLIDDEMRARFGAAFPTVDMDATGWIDVLLARLAAPQRELEDEWNAKAAARMSLFSDAVAGPPGPTGRRAAAIIEEIVGKNCAVGVSAKGASAT